MNEVNLSSVEQKSLRGALASTTPRQESQSLAVVSKAVPKEVPPTVEATLQEKKASELNDQVVDLVGQGPKVQEEQLEAAVTKLNDYIQNVQRDLEFKTDDASGKTVVTVIDRRTDEVVRQIPDDVALTMAQNLRQDEPLSLFNIKA
jgi:flagellar protein FlaG